jgi:hypothetical protein
MRDRQRGGMTTLGMVPTLEEDHLLAVSCACGRTLLSSNQRGLCAQVASHWRLRHPEPIVVTPEEFVARHAFAAWEGD